jgi:hypothetical protein
LEDYDIVPLCTNLGRFKRLKKINLVSRGMCVRGGFAGSEEESEAVVNFVKWCCG